MRRQMAGNLIGQSARVARVVTGVLNCRRKKGGSGRYGGELFRTDKLMQGDDS